MYIVTGKRGHSILRMKVSLVISVYVGRVVDVVIDLILCVGCRSPSCLSRCISLSINLYDIVCRFADIRYGYVVDQQPIGRLLFRQYCQDKKPAYHQYNLFLDAIEKYEIEMDENRVELAIDLFERYLKRGGSEVVDILNDSLISQCEARLYTRGRELFIEIAQTVKNFLAGEPFAAFLTSFYFYR